MESGINPMAIDDSGPGGGSGYGGGGFSPGLPDPTGGGLQLQAGQSGEDQYARRPGMKRRMTPMPNQPGPMGNGGVDPNMVATVMQAFLQMMQGGGQPGTGRSPQQPMGGMPMGQAGGLPMQAFAYGGVVNRPTIGLLGERGPEAVIPLNQGQSQGFGPAPPQMPQQGMQPQMPTLGGFGAGARNQSMSQLPGQNPMGGYGMAPWMFGAARDAGIYGPTPPQGIMDAMRSQMMQDAAAQSRSARLGLMGRTDIDPSTYGFQALMSDLQGQQNVARGMSAADLALRQQQAEFLQRLFLNEHGQGWGQVHQRDRAAQEGFDWGGLAGSVAKLAPMAFGAPPVPA